MIASNTEFCEFIISPYSTALSPLSTLVVCACQIASPPEYHSILSLLLSTKVFMSKVDFSISFIEVDKLGSRVSEFKNFALDLILIVP